MTNEQCPPEVRPFLEAIDKNHTQITDTCGYLSKLKARLDKTKRALKAKPSLTSQIQMLITDLQAAKSAPELYTASEMGNSLDVLLRDFQRKLQDGFPSNLKHACDTARLGFQAKADGLFVVGPFVVVTNAPKETAVIQYAKVAIIQDVPLNVQTIVAHATALKANLIDSPVDLTRFRKDIHEAIRVAVARRETRTPVGDLRVELPASFRELSFIRNTLGSTPKKGAADEYSLARFIIELKYFIQSDDNVNSPQQCRLEPAVIENTKNPKKSIFVPKDVALAFGEGTYFQAIIMQQK